MQLKPFLLALPLAVLVPYVGACHGHDEETVAGLEDVVYQGSATDEGLQALLAAPAKAGSRQARITSPAANAKLTEAPTFEWSFTSAPTGSRAPGGPKHERRAGAPFPPPFGRERTAHAHGTPMSGTGYFLLLSAPNDDKLLRVFTTQTSYKPDAAAWEKVKKATGPVRAVVTTALFDQNRIISDGGPFEGAAVTFEVAR